jgi:hypothetical protein
VADFQGGWTCYVEQWFYGDRAKKATWLYANGVELPSLRWGHTPDTAEPAYVTDGGGDVKRRAAGWRDSGYGNRQRSKKPAYVSNVGGRQRARALVSWCGNHVKDGENRERLGKKAANATPPEFRDLLLSIARSAERRAA